MLILLCLLKLLAKKVNKIASRTKWVSKKLKHGLLLVCGFWLAWTWLLWWQASLQPPNGIVVLGGGIKREMLAAKLAKSYPSLPVIISSGSSLPCLYRIFVEESGVAWQRVRVDFRAVDTLTNFTTLLPYLQSNQSRKVFMITDQGNLPRASVLAWLVWGSRGIATQAVLVEGAGHYESWPKTFVESIRAIAWVLLGERTVANSYHSEAELQSRMNLRQSRCEVGSAVLPDHI